MREWKLTGAAFNRIKPKERELAKLKAQLERTEILIQIANLELAKAIHEELKLDRIVNFALDAEHKKDGYFIVTEIPANVCPGCGELHNELHTENHSIH